MAKKKKLDPFSVSLSELETRDLVNWLSDEIQGAYDARNSVIARGGDLDYYWWMLYGQGRRAPGAKPRPDAADLGSYLVTEKVDALTARACKTIFVDPVWTVEGWGEAASRAPLVEEFHQWGQKVLVLERRYECGRGLWTEESTLPGFLHSTHAVYMMMVDFAPVYSDFRLEEDYKVRHLYPDLQFAIPLSDGRSLCIYKDLDRTCKSFAQFSQKDADAYREFYHTAKRCVDDYIGPATYPSRRSIGCHCAHAED